MSDEYSREDPTSLSPYTPDPVELSIRRANDPLKSLAFTLLVIRDLDPSVSRPGPLANYENRNSAIYLALRQALLAGLPAGVRGSEDPEWPVAYIQLPTGQISWHIPAYPSPWDGHTTEEKYDRIQAFADSISPVPAL